MDFLNGSGAAAVGTAEPRGMCEPASPHALHTEISPALQAVARFYDHAMPTLELHRWLRAQGVDFAHTLPLAGPIAECSVVTGGSMFQFADPDESGAVLAVVHVVNGEDAETPIGLVAWCRSEPATFWTYPDGLPALGIDQIDNPATYFADRPLLVHRSPLAWLRSNCCGMVPLDTDALWSLLDALPGRANGYALAAESVEHGHALQAGLRPLPSRVRVVAPRRGIAA
jgi:hypothetical protein